MYIYATNQYLLHHLWPPNSCCKKLCERDLYAISFFWRIRVTTQNTLITITVIWRWGSAALMSWNHAINSSAVFYWWSRKSWRENLSQKDKAAIKVYTSKSGKFLLWLNAAMNWHWPNWRLQHRQSTAKQKERLLFSEVIIRLNALAPRQQHSDGRQQCASASGPARGGADSC